MTVKKNLIFILFSFLFIFSANAEPKVSCKDISTIPKINDVKNLTSERLEFIDKCLNEYVKNKIIKLEEPKFGAEVLDFVVFKMNKEQIYKDAGNIYLNNLDKKQINELYEISIKNFPKVKFLYWFFHHNNNDRLSKIFQQYYKINKLAGLHVARYILEYRYDDKINEFKKIIEPILGKNDANLFLIEHLKSANDALRKNICEHYLIYQNHKTSTDKVFNIISKKIDKGDLTNHACVLNHYLYIKRDYDKFRELLKITGPYEEIYGPVFFNYIFTKQENINKEEFTTVLETLFKSRPQARSYAIFINGIYPDLIKIPTSKKLLNDKIDDCIIKKFECFNESLNENDFVKIKSSIREIIFITSMLNDNIEKLLLFFSKQVESSSLNLYSKADIIDSLEDLTFYLNKKPNVKLKEFIYENKTKLLVQNAREISQNDKLSELLKITTWDQMDDILRGNFKKANEIVLSNWFQEAVSHIHHATSKKYFDRLNDLLLQTITSDFPEKTSAIAKKMSKRWNEIYPSELDSPTHLQTLWNLALLDRINSYVHFTLGLQLSKNNEEQNYKFMELKTRYFIQEGNYKIANRIAANNYNQFKKKLGNINNELIYEKIHDSKQLDKKAETLKLGRLCDASSLLVISNRLLGLEDGMEPFSEFCEPHFDKILSTFPLFAVTYIIEKLYYETLLIDLNKRKNISTKTIENAYKILNDPNVSNSSKVVVAFQLLVYQKNYDFKSFNPNINDLIEIYKKEGLTTNQLIDRFWVFVKTFSLILEKDSTLKYDSKSEETKDQKLVYSLLDEASLILEERYNSSYIPSSKGIVYNPVMLENLIKVHTKIKNSNVFDNNFDEKFFKIFNLLKFDQPEKLILTSIKKRKQKNKNNLKEITRRKFIIDTLLNEKIIKSEKTRLTMELRNLQGSINIINDPINNQIQFSTLKSIQKDLNNDQIFLSYLTNASSNSIAVYVISKENVEIRVINNLKNIRDASISLKDNISENINERFIKDGYYLYEKLFKPFITESINEIIISPHSFIYGIPFHILSTKPYVEKKLVNYFFGTNYEWFGINNKISIKTNLSLDKKESNDKGSYTFFGVGNPIFSTSNNIEKEIKLGLLNTNKRGITFSEKKFPQLKETQNEIERISKLPIFSKSTLLLEKQATEQNVKNSKELSNATVISFATHGLAYGEMNRHSEPGLLMTNNNLDNGYLSMSEIAGLNLDADLVILSACNTGSSSSLNSSPFSGLATSFLAAGSKRVLASHWSVYDKSTSLLMQEILKAKLNETVSWSEAHFKGINQFLKKYKKYSSPYYWGAFTLFQQ